MSDELVRHHVIAVLKQLRDRDRIIDGRIQAQADRGRQVVNAIMLDREEWAIVDCSTGATLATGDGGPERLDMLVDSPQGEDWVWLHTLTRDLRRVTTRGLPESLCDALEEWVEDPSVPHRAIARVTGWTVGRVAQARGT